MLAIKCETKILNLLFIIQQADNFISFCQRQSFFLVNDYEVFFLFKIDVVALIDDGIAIILHYIRFQPCVDFQSRELFAIFYVLC